MKLNELSIAKTLNRLLSYERQGRRSGSVVHSGGQLIKEFPDEQIPAEIHVAMAEQKRKIPLARNSACPCGSGKRFKKCHWEKPEKAVIA